MNPQELKKLYNELVNYFNALDKFTQKTISELIQEKEEGIDETKNVKKLTATITRYLSLSEKERISEAIIQKKIIELFFGKDEQRQLKVKLIEDSKKNKQQLIDSKNKLKKTIAETKGNTDAQTQNYVSHVNLYVYENLDSIICLNRYKEIQDIIKKSEKPYETASPIVTDTLHEALVDAGRIDSTAALSFSHLSQIDDWSNIKTDLRKKLPASRPQAATVPTVINNSLVPNTPIGNTPFVTNGVETHYTRGNTGVAIPPSIEGSTETIPSTSATVNSSRFRTTENDPKPIDPQTTLLNLNLERTEGALSKAQDEIKSLKQQIDKKTEEINNLRYSLERSKREDSLLDRITATVGQTRKSSPVNNLSETITITTSSGEQATSVSEPTLLQEENEKLKKTLEKTIQSQEELQQLIDKQIEEKESLEDKLREQITALQSQLNLEKLSYEKLQKEFTTQSGSLEKVNADYLQLDSSTNETKQRNFLLTTQFKEKAEELNRAKIQLEKLKEEIARGGDELQLSLLTEKKLTETQAKRIKELETDLNESARLRVALEAKASELNSTLTTIKELKESLQTKTTNLESAKNESAQLAENITDLAKNKKEETGKLNLLLAEKENENKKLQEEFTKIRNELIQTIKKLKSNLNRLVKKEEKTNSVQSYYQFGVEDQEEEEIESENYVALSTKELLSELGSLQQKYFSTTELTDQELPSVSKQEQELSQIRHKLIQSILKVKANLEKLAGEIKISSSQASPPDLNPQSLSNLETGVYETYSTEDLFSEFGNLLEEFLEAKQKLNSTDENDEADIISNKDASLSDFEDDAEIEEDDLFSFTQTQPANPTELLINTLNRKEELETEVEELKTELESLKTVNKKVQQQVDAIPALEENLRQAQTSTQNGMNYLTSIVKTLQKINPFFSEGANPQLTEKLQKIIKNFEELNALQKKDEALTIQQIENELTLEDCSKNESSNASGQLPSLAAEKQTLSISLEENNSCIQEKRKEINLQLETVNLDLEAVIKEFSEKHQALQSQLVTIDSENKESSDTIKRLQEENEKLSSTLHEENEKLSSALREESKELENQTEITRLTAQERDGYRKNAKTFKEQNQTLQSQFEQAKDEAERLQKEVTSTKDETYKLQQQVDAIPALKESLRQFKLEAETANNELQAANEEIKKLKEENQAPQDLDDDSELEPEDEDEKLDFSRQKNSTDKMSVSSSTSDRLESDIIARRIDSQGMLTMKQPSEETSPKVTLSDEELKFFTDPKQNLHRTKKLGSTLSVDSSDSSSSSGIFANEEDTNSSSRDSLESKENDSGHDSYNKDNKETTLMTLNIKKCEELTAGIIKEKIAKEQVNPPLIREDLEGLKTPILQTVLSEINPSQDLIILDPSETPLTKFIEENSQLDEENDIQEALANEFRVTIEAAIKQKIQETSDTKNQKTDKLLDSFYQYQTSTIFPQTTARAKAILQEKLSDYGIVVPAPVLQHLKNTQHKSFKDLAENTTSQDELRKILEAKPLAELNSLQDDKIAELSPSLQEFHENTPKLAEEIADSYLRYLSRDFTAKAQDIIDSNSSLAERVQSLGLDAQHLANETIQHPANSTLINSLTEKVLIELINQSNTSNASVDEEKIKSLFSVEESNITSAITTTLSELETKQKKEVLIDRLFAQLDANKVRETLIEKVKPTLISELSKKSYFLDKPTAKKLEQEVSTLTREQLESVKEQLKTQFRTKSLDTLQAYVNGSTNHKNDLIERIIHLETANQAKSLFKEAEETAIRLAKEEIDSYSKKTVEDLVAHYQGTLDFIENSTDRMHLAMRSATCRELHDFLKENIHSLNAIEKASGQAFTLRKAELEAKRDASISDKDKSQYKRAIELIDKILEQKTARKFLEKGNIQEESPIEVTIIRLSFIAKGLEKAIAANNDKGENQTIVKAKNSSHFFKCTTKDALVDDRQKLLEELGQEPSKTPYATLQDAKATYQNIDFKSGHTLLEGIRVSNKLFAYKAVKTDYMIEFSVDSIHKDSKPVTSIEKHVTNKDFVRNSTESMLEFAQGKNNSLGDKSVGILILNTNDLNWKARYALIKAHEQVFPTQAMPLLLLEGKITNADLKAKPKLKKELDNLRDKLISEFKKKEGPEDQHIEALNTHTTLLAPRA